MSIRNKISTHVLQKLHTPSNRITFLMSLDDDDDDDDDDVDVDDAAADVDNSGDDGDVTNLLI